jgi:hypothetical protein
MPGFLSLSSHQEPGLGRSEFLLSEEARAVQIGESGELVRQFSSA